MQGYNHLQAADCCVQCSQHGGVPCGGLMLSESACCAGWVSTCRYRPMPMPHTWASCSSLMSSATLSRLSGSQTRSCTVYTACLKGFGGGSSSGSMGRFSSFQLHHLGMRDVWVAVQSLAVPCSCTSVSFARQIAPPSLLQ